MTFATSVRVCLAAAVAAGAVWTAPVHAATPLEGRTVTGAKVDAYDPSAVMIYDPDQDLTWVRDWSLNGGPAPFDIQYDFISTFSIGEYSGWRLPALSSDGAIDCIYSLSNCRGELSNLWVNVLGNTFGQARVNSGPFLNMPEVSYSPYSYPVNYWTGASGTISYDFDYYVFYITFDSWAGYHEQTSPWQERYIVAVRDGDVAAAVPEVGSWGMFLMGLYVVAAAMRRRSAG